MQTNYGENEINALLQKVRIFNRDIGEFQVLAITDNFDYAVKLSNGTILLKFEELQDDERDALTPNQLSIIANRFISSSTQTINIKKTEQTSSLSQESQPIKKKSGFGKSITIIAVVLIAIVGGYSIFNNINNSDGLDSNESYLEKVMTIEEIERSQPTNFLSASGDYKENFWGDKINVNCVITNKATVATYKDVVVRITYYTKTKTAIGIKEYTVYEVFSPNSTKTVKLKIDNYKDVNAIEWEVINAMND